MTESDNELYLSQVEDEEEHVDSLDKHQLSVGGAKPSITKLIIGLAILFAIIIGFVIWKLTHTKTHNQQVSKPPNITITPNKHTRFGPTTYIEDKPKPPPTITIPKSDPSLTGCPMPFKATKTAAIIPNNKSKMMKRRPNKEVDKTTVEISQPISIDMETINKTVLEDTKQDNADHTASDTFFEKPLPGEDDIDPFKDDYETSPLSDLIGSIKTAEESYGLDEEDV